MKLKVLAIVLLLVVGGAAIVVATGGLPSNAAAASTYLTSQATVTDVSDDVAATGAIAATTSWSLAFGVAPTTSTADDSSGSDAAATGTWTVTEVKAKIGEAVKKGQLLATASNATLAADVAAARNDVTSANLQYLLAKESYDTAVEDGNSDAIRQSRIGLLNATNGLATAKAKLVDLQRTTARAKLVAPAAGMVTAVNVSAGSDAPSGAAIDHRRVDVPGHRGCRGERRLLDPLGPGGVGLGGGDRRGAERDGRLDRPHGFVLLFRLGEWRRLVRGHDHPEGAAANAPLRDDRRHHDHDGIRERRPGRAGGSDPRNGRELLGAGGSRTASPKPER